MKITRTLHFMFALAMIAALYVGLSSNLTHASRPENTSAEVPSGKPAAMIDLGSVEGVQAVKGEWRYSDTKIVETDFRGPGADRQPTGAPVKTYDYTPHAGGADFDDSKWEVISPTSLDQRRGNGRLGFNWYRIKLTIPDRIGDFDPSGTTAVFETSLDDYAEIWVDGELSRALGQSGGSVIAGWNAENHLVVGRNVKPGQQIQLAIFGVNGPLSNPPTNFIYIRYAKLSFYKTEPGPVALTPSEVNVEVVRNDRAMDEVVGPNPKLFKLADGFKFTEGPVWINKDGGYLLFSDPNANTIYKYHDGKLEVFRTPSGYNGADIAEYGQPGSNGLTLDTQGRLTINQHGNHRVVRDENDGTQTVLADSYQGKRLNSPNDLVYRSDGTLFFTDPPFGFPKFFNDPRKQLPFSGVYSIYQGKLQLVSKDFTGPNGIAFSPDEKYLYVGNWPRSLTGQELRKEDEPVSEIGDKHKAIMRYEVQPDGTLKNGKLFFDFTNAQGEDGLDGIKVDEKGNLYVSAPGGLWVISPAGKHLGTIITPKHAHNFAWGDADGKTLYICARSGLYRMRLNVAGGNRRVLTTATPTQPLPAIVRLDPRFDQIVTPDAVLDQIADGFAWAEGPVWNRTGKYLLFSDVPNNRIVKWKAGEGTGVFLQPSGYSAAEPFTGREPGSNGLTFDKEGRLVFCQHGDRRISRLEKNGTRTTLVDNYQGKRLNSPNDLVFKSNGDLYFTDPPFGLPQTFNDPKKELPFQGVYRLSRDGKLTLLTTEVEAPNGIAFSPDEKKLYVADSARALWFVFEVKPDGTLSPGKVLFDGTAESKGRPGVADSLKVDVYGNIFAAAPGGLFILAPDGALLGRIDLGTATGNCAWGEDGSTLFITSNTVVYRVRLKTRGVGTTVQGFKRLGDAKISTFTNGWRGGLS
ncbi:MAG TPA: SMP-30/gluconolactonase/LRE family protein [Pyrinomonadaceae bacterium]|nr:SMP-30/gluconolactonase/LRE family protein [Pyrinomonadaceae bacterium]